MKIWRKVEGATALVLDESLSNVENMYMFRATRSLYKKYLQEIFAEMFGDDPLVVRYNANSVRKYWEKRWLTLKNNETDGVSKAHFAQTAHSKETEKHYLDRQGTSEDRDRLLNIYDEDLNRQLEEPDDVEVEVDYESTDEEDLYDEESPAREVKFEDIVYNSCQSACKYRQLVIRLCNLSL